MSDFVYVNILNEGQLPWLRETGPLFGYKLSVGMYQLIRKDPRINIELAPTPRDAELAKEKYLKSKEVTESKTIILHDEIAVEDSTPVITEEIVDEKDNLDLETYIAQVDTVLNTPGREESIKKDKTTTVEKHKKYDDSELNLMTKLELKNILKERGYISGPYAGKYHDTVEMLIHKVKSTQ